MRNERRRLLAKYSSASDEKANDRLVKPLRVSKKMRPFVRRMRLRPAEIDLSDPALALRFEQGREEMRRILVKKKIPEAKIERAIEETLAIAANYQLQAMRELDTRQDHSRSANNAKRLIQRLTELAAAISKLPPVAKGKLNAIVAGQTGQFFDSETFAAITHNVAAVLPELAPRKHAQDAFDVIDQPVFGVTRTSSPEIIELWEMIPAETRRRVEQKIRCAAGKTSANEFLRHFAVLVGRYLPRSKRGRLPTLQRHYIGQVGKIWQTFGLTIGRAYDGAAGKSVASSFQQYCSAGLSAVGDDRKISGRQTRAIKNDLRKRSGSGLKLLG